MRRNNDSLQFLSPKSIDDGSSDEISRDAAVEDIVCVDSVMTAESIRLPDVRSSTSPSVDRALKDAQDKLSVGGATFEMSERSITPEEDPIEKRMPTTKKDHLTRVNEAFKNRGGRRSLRI